MSRVSDLRVHLEAYEARGPEAKTVAAVLDLLETAASPLADDNYVPGHVTASAFVIDKGHEMLLMIHHGKLHRWLQPGGHIDPGESALTAAIREVEEETGVVGVPLGSGVFDVDVHDIPAHGGRPPHLHYDVRFLLEATKNQLSNSAEVNDVRWVPLSDVSDLTTESSVLRPTAKIMRLFG